MVEFHAAVCRECDWERATLTREQAEHMKRVHEDWLGHAVVVVERDGG